MAEIKSPVVKIAITTDATVTRLRICRATCSGVLVAITMPS